MTSLLLCLFYFDPLELELDPGLRRELTLLPGAVLYRSEFHRVFTGPLLHGSDEHVVFNCISFLWKGAQLETKKFGSLVFLGVLTALTALAGAFHCAIAYFAGEVLYATTGEGLWTPCVGFSGVIFALKVLMPERSHQMVMGFPMPGRWACWAELIAIQVMVPNASMTGHAAGILAGLTFKQFFPLR